MRKAISFFQYSFLLFILAYTKYGFIYTSKIAGNIGARSVLALGPLLGIGKPYIDLYDVPPPGYLYLISTFVKMFGLNIVTFRVLHYAVSILAGTFLILIINKSIKNIYLRLISWISLCLILFSKMVQTDMASIDITGLMFSLIGFYIILSVKNEIYKIGMSTAFFIMATLTKEIYVFSIITVIIELIILHYKSKSDYSFIINQTKAALIAFIPIGLISYYLYAINSFSGFLSITADKQILVQNGSVFLLFKNLYSNFTRFIDKYFEFPNFLTLLIITLVIINLFYLIKTLKSKSNNKNVSTKYSSYIKTAIYAFTLFIGYFFYGQFTFDVRQIPFITGLILIITLITDYHFDALSSFKYNIVTKTIVILIFGLSIYPSSFILNSYKENSTVYRDYSFELNNYIKDRVESNKCILHIYGWEVGPTYIYTERKPCTKYFLTNLLMIITSKKDEFRQEIVNNPAAAIIYSIHFSDTNIEYYDENIFDFTSVVKNCYTPDPKYINYTNYFPGKVTLYWPKGNLTEKEMKDCIKSNGF